MEEQSVNEVAVLLRENPLFATLTDEDINYLVNVGEKTTYYINQQVFSEKEKGKYFCIVSQGVFLLKLQDYRTRLYRRGEIFGEVSVFSEEYRMGTAIAQEAGSTLIRFKVTKLFNPNQVPTETALRVAKLLAKTMVLYLHNQKVLPTTELLKQGESAKLEFKSAYDQNTRAAVLKTMAGFMNCEGGTLLIGVSNNKKLIGIPEMSDYDKQDKWLTAFNSTVLKRLGKHNGHLLHTKFEEINGQWLVRIDCKSSVRPVFLTDDKDNEFFYIRQNGSTHLLKQHSEVLKYVLERFSASVI